MKGRIIRDLVPSAENMRNSEGAFVTLKDGSILFAYSRYANESHDSSPADIYGVISYDNGESFGEPFLMIRHEDMNARNIMSVSFLRMENGDLGMFFVINRGDWICLPHFVRSKDEGKTWSEPVCCVNREGFFVLNNDRVIRLPSGRILLVTSTVERETDAYGFSLGNNQGFFQAFGSDDDGYTWFPVNESFTLPVCRALKLGVQEPGAVVLKDGRIWSFIRNDSGRQYETFSSDEGVTWTPPLPSVFTSPYSPMSAKRLSDGRIMAIWNPIPVHTENGRREGEFWNASRAPLVYAFSEDETETFSQRTVLEEDDDKRGFCYVAIHEVSDGILLGYCAGGVEDTRVHSRLRIRKIPMNEL